VTTVRECDRCQATARGAKLEAGWDSSPIYESKKIKGQKKKRFIDMLHLCKACKEFGAKLHYDPPSISEPTSKHAKLQPPLYPPE